LRSHPPSHETRARPKQCNSLPTSPRRQGRLPVPRAPSATTPQEREPVPRSYTTAPQSATLGKHWGWREGRGRGGRGAWVVRGGHAELSAPCGSESRSTLPPPLPRMQWGNGRGGSRGKIRAQSTRRAPGALPGGTPAHGKARVLRCGWLGGVARGRSWGRVSTGCRVATRCDCGRHNQKKENPPPLARATWQGAGMTPQPHAAPHATHCTALLAFYSVLGSVSTGGRAWGGLGLRVLGVAVGSPN
jgi:hypothetical protein